MRLDPIQVIQHASTLPTNRLFRSAGERAAADDVSAQLERAGLRVERAESPSLSIPIGIIILAVTAWLWLVVAKALPDATLWSRLTWWELSLGSLFWAATRAATRGSAREQSRSSSHVLGTLRAPEPSAARVVIVTRLRTCSAWYSEAFHWGVLGLAVLIGVALFSSLVDSAIRNEPRVGQALFGCEWMALLLLLLGPKAAAARPVQGDNRTGLALLAELARVWPTGARGRPETVFVATPDSAALARQMQSLLPGDCPTLVVVLDAPGVGGELLVLGHGPAARLARDAARDLWVPYRAPRWAARRLGHGAFRRRGYDCVSLCGARTDRPIDPATVMATAQLAIEIALRWAKPHQTARSAAKSSQNPG
ncbi:MAG: hypothetical protein P4L84_12130 [Isosphaeraceae bacterium]|nr:hypothetical protein [Isosphaeraceae bacterium]